MTVPRILLVIPPLTQLNTPYPSTAYLSGFLQSRGIASEQADLGIEMVLRLFSRDGLRRLFSLIRSQRRDLPMEARRMLANKQAYLDTIGTVVSFLQGKHPSAATHLIRAGILPQGPRFRGRAKFPRGMLLEDQAKQWATFYLEDLADLVQATVAPHFSLSRYAEQIVHATSSFDGIASAMAEPPTFTDELLLGALWGHIDRVKPTLVGLSVPFPGNLYGAFRIAQGIKQHRPDISIVLGGGYANTELRRIADLRVFDYVDFITLDDGERPLLSLIEHLGGKRPRQSLCRTFYRENSRVCFTDDASIADFSMDEIGCPTYRGLDLDRYLTILDSTNPMHRLWSEGHWNKLTVAHGCYWKQCTFCDVGLNYISRYEMTPIQRLIGQIEQLIVETGRRGFHFVDEAAPPAGLKALALALLERDIAMTWWGNIRFEAAFTPDLCRLLAASGCIAVTAGLETASDRLLEKMKKGITVDQTALVAKAFNDSGILVHAYLMYGFPSETVQDTIDALERVRQLIAAGLIQSGFWHRFTTTAHSPIGLNPASHGLRILGPEFQGFAENDLLHRGRGSAVPEWLGKGLRRSMLNFIEQRGLNMDVREWFDYAAPKPRISPTWVQRLLKSPLAVDEVRAERRCVWLGGVPVCEPSGKATRLVLSGNSIARTVVFADRQALWLTDLIKRSTPRNKPELYPRVQEVRATFPEGQAEFERFLESRTWKEVRSAGLLLI